MNQKSVAFLLLAIFAISSCKKSENQPNNTTPPAKKIAPDGFTFANTKQVSVAITLLASDNTPLPGVPVTLYSNLVELENGNADETSALFTGLTDKSGNINATVNLPVATDTVLVDAKYTGIIRNVKAYVTGTAITATLGGANIVSGNVALNNFTPRISTRRPAVVNGINSTNYVSMGLTDLEGRPSYLVSPGDVISSTLTSFVNTSLPEGKNVALTHPQYLQSTATGTVNIAQTSQVWVTFVSEGAGYLNGVGWYSYPTNNPPTTAAALATVNIMFPNASLYASGGNMHPGDKVLLGTFSPGTSIGFVLLQNAWEYSNLDNTSGVKWYSNSNLNAQPDSLQQHSVLLYDAADNLYLTGFEDMDRTNPGCDNDFNDVVFYTTSNPVAAISNVGVEPIDKPGDTDGDGVSDVFDQYPTDPTRAYNNYYPSSSTYATIAFEDNWPSVGDYDMNDLVVNYQYKIVSNAATNVVEVYANYAVQAAGASFKNGFGVQFPFAASLVKTVTGQKAISNYITLAGNGVEAGQTNAVIIPFDNYNALINNYAGAYFINTETSLPKVTGDTAKVYMQFTSPVTAATLGSAPFNPFLISNLRRGYEVHLPGYQPTALANTKLFGTADDASKPASGIYYVSPGNWPWALSFPGTFTYPIEGVNISNAYLHFLDWAGSAGTTYTDWYYNTGAGYQNTSNLYTK